MDPTPKPTSQFGNWTRGWEDEVKNDSIPLSVRFREVEQSVCNCASQETCLRARSRESE